MYKRQDPSYSAPSSASGGGATCDGTGVSKPVLLYLPGIELSGYSAYRQYEALSESFDVRYLAVPVDDRSAFDELVALVRNAIQDIALEGTDAPAKEQPVQQSAHVAMATGTTTSTNTSAHVGNDSKTIPAASAEGSPPADSRRAEHRRVFLCGESFGGVLALNVALHESKPPTGLAGLILINPATSVKSSWTPNLLPVLDALESLPVQRPPSYRKAHTPHSCPRRLHRRPPSIAPHPGIHAGPAGG